jgi:Ca-activated chloride channel family protein
VLVVMAMVLFAPVGAMAQGMLVPTDERIEPLTLTQHTVSFEVADNGAVTHVTQVFRNHTSTPLEATYYFAVPPGAVTTDFALWMNGERIRGEVLRRDEARRIYEEIVRRTRDPGLLEYVDGELFQASIFPVPPNGDQTVEIEFANVLERQGDLLHYRYPIHESASAEIPMFSVSGDIQSTHRIASLYAPYHTIEEDIARDGRSARVSMEESGASVERDFELFIGLTGEELGFTVLSHAEDGGEDGYFMVTIAPSPDLEDLEVLPKQVTFVVDTSGSMNGEKMEQARAMLRYCVENLSARDTFQIVAFSSGVRAAFEAPVPADREHVRQAQEFIDGMVARGNTNISGALERALEDPASAERPHAVIFVTDGLPTEGQTDVESIIQIARRGVSDGDRRVFAFGVGYDVNTRLLDGVARRGRGETGYVRPREDISDVVGTFFDSIGSPLLTQLSLDFGGVRVRDMYPQPLPDLYRNRDVVVFGRYRADQSTTVRVRGQAAGQQWERTFGATFAPREGADTSFVANLWAHRRVDALLTEIEESGETQARIDEVVELATEWGIVTPYTSYLAVDPSERIQRPQPGPGIPRPSPMPMGGAVDFDAPEREAMMDSSSAGRGGFGSGRRAPSAAQAPRQQVSGEAAVEESIARNEARTRTTVADEPADQRRAAGRTFERSGGVWIEASIATRSVDERITWGSEEYFELLRANPELRDVLALGERVRFEHRGRVIEIIP